MGGIYLFESSEKASVFSQIFPDESSRATSLDTLAVPPSQSERLRFVGKLLDDKEKPFASHYLCTLEAFREALVLSHEDVDFAMAQLEPLPKNLYFKCLFHEYLDSPLSEDKTSLVFSLIERLKETEILQKNEFTIVPEVSGTLLFREFAKHLQQSLGQRKIETKWAHAWEEGTLSKRPLCFYGTHEATVKATLRWVNQQLEKGVPPEEIWLWYDGSPWTQWLLQCEASYHKISLLEQKPTYPSSPLSTWAQLMEGIRNDLHHPIDDRLKLIHRLMKYSSWRATDLDTYLDQLCERGILSPLERSSLPRETKASQRTPTKATGIRMASHHHYFSTSKIVSAGFLEDLGEKPLFSSFELKKLEQAGIPVSLQTQVRLTDHCKVIYQKSHRRRVLFSTSQGQLLSASNCFREFQLRPTPPMLRDTPSEALPISRQTFSASDLSAYARCPADYFYRRELRLNNPDFEKREAQLFGQAVHSALEQIFRDQEKTPKNHDLVFESVLSKFFPFSTVERRLWKAKFSQIIVNLNQLEDTLTSTFGSLKTISLEETFEFSRDGYSFRGKMDRLCVDEQGAWLVIDYKTGTVDFTPEHIGRGQNFQALFYYEAVRQQLGDKLLGVLFYDLKENEVRRGFFNEQWVSKLAKSQLVRGHVLPIEKLETLLVQGWGHAKKTISDIQAGHFEAIPDANHCRFCSSEPLCQKAYGHA